MDLQENYTEVVDDLAVFAKRPSNAALISAYDLHFKHFDDAPKLPPTSGPQDYLRETRLVFVDSGGYELIPDFDRTEFKTFAYGPKAGYGLEQYKKVLQTLMALEEPLPLAIANFDRDSIGKPIGDQIIAARELFYDFSGPLKDFILKPWTPDSSKVDPRKMTDDDFVNLAGFDIVGIVEKELGRTPFADSRRWRYSATVWTMQNSGRYLSTYGADSIRLLLHYISLLEQRSSRACLG